MPPYVIPDKCDGCQGEKVPLCEVVCPGNLMVIEKDSGKAVCREPGDCWDCMTCTKSCARQAIQTRIQYQLAFYPGKLIPLVGPSSVTWTLIDCHGNVERFIMRTLAGDDEDEI